MTASLIYPEKNLGKEFWDRVYAKAQQMYGTTQIPVNTFNKVWILADKATVYEHNQTAYVLKGHLKVMLEEDYLALQKHSPSFFKEGVRGSSNNSHSIASQIIKQIILPELEKEVNTGKNFSTLRQIFNSLILADWYKTTLKKSLLTQLYANQNKIKGIERGIPPLFYKEGARGSSIHPQQDLSPESIYQQYLKAYKKGVFNYIKEESDLVSLRGTSEASDEAISSEGPSTPGLPGGNHKRTTIPRKYFSGGFGANVQETVEHAMSPTEQSRAQETIATGHDFAMKVILDINDSYQAKNSNKLSTSKAMISTQLLGAIIRDFQGHVLLPILMSLNLNNPESVPFESGSINYTLGVTKGSSTVKITLYRGRFITTELYEMTIDKISYMQILSVNNLLKKCLRLKK